jgi:hypothetical protein
MVTKDTNKTLSNSTSQVDYDDLLNRKHAAERAIEAAQSEYQKATLAAERGEANAIGRKVEAFEALELARQRARDIDSALMEWQCELDAEKKRRENLELQRKWKEAAKHLDDRAKAAADFAKYAAWLAEAWERIEDTTMKARFALPFRPSDAQLIANSKLEDVVKEEFTRLGANAFGKRVLGDPRKIVPFVDVIEDANKFMLRSRPKAEEESESK